MSAQTTPDPRYSHPLKKYDKRADNHGNIDEYNQERKRGPKLKSRKDLHGRKSVTYLRQMESHKSPVEMFQDAIAAKNYALAWSIRSDVRAEAVGKPYVAINPDAVERHDQADISRIAVAINNLQIVNGAEAKQLAKPGHAEADAKREAQVIEGKEVADTSRSGVDLDPKPIEAGAKATPVR